MTDRKLLLDLMDQAVRDITLRMTGIELVRVEQAASHREDGANPLLSIEIKGGDGFTLFYSAEERLLRAIAQRMKRRPVEDLAEAVEYDKEYFNVICGHAVSSYNRIKKTSLRFGVPCYQNGGGGLQSGSLALFYRSSEGSASMESACDQKNNWEGA